MNPRATRAARGLARHAQDALTPRGLVFAALTRERGDARRLAQAAARAGARVVVTVGGDGTVAEAAAALAGGTTALAPLPAGSTNVFSRSLGWPPGGAAALAALVARLDAGGPATAVGIGTVHAGDVSRPFVMNAGAGLDARTVAIVEAHPALKHRLRHAGFAAAVVAAHRRLRRAAPLTVTVDGGPPFELATMSVACGAPYAYLGPRALDLVPGADHGGRLAWLGVSDVRAVAVARVVAGAVRGGRHAVSAGVAHGTGARDITVSCVEPVPLQADGEGLGAHLDMRFTAGPALLVVRP